MLSAVQEWTFFGLLEAFLSELNHTFNTDDFLTRDVSNTSYVDTTKLPSVVKSLALERFKKFYPQDLLSPLEYEDMVTRFKTEALFEVQLLVAEHHDPDLRCRTAKNCTKYVIMIVDFLRHFFSPYEFVSPRPLPFVEVWFCAIMLCDTLSGVVEQLLLREHFIETIDVVHPKKLMHARFQAAAWCEWRRAFLSDLSLQHYGTLLEGGDVSTAHDHCDSEKRRLIARDISTYTQEHWIPLCDNHCKSSESFSIDEQRLVAILQSGGIPVIMGDFSEEKLKFDVKRADEVSAYIAISHVW